MISSYTTEISGSDVPNRSDVHNVSGYVSEFERFDDLFSENTGVDRMTPESLNRIREGLERMRKEREESIEWKLESRVRDLRCLFDEVISLYDQRIQSLLERTHQ